jgi:ATP-dependent Clp protease ATP-binding subunit ClpA
MCIKRVYAIAVEQALLSAESFAFSDGDAKFVGLNHLLMAIFEQAGIDKTHFFSMPEQCRYTEISEKMTTSLRVAERAENAKPLRYSGDLKTVLQRARACARSVGSHTCYLEHVLLILLSFTHKNELKELLTNAGVSPRLNDAIRLYCQEFRIPRRQRAFCVPHRQTHRHRTFV